MTLLDFTFTVSGIGLFLSLALLYLNKREVIDLVVSSGREPEGSLEQKWREVETALFNEKNALHQIQRVAGLTTELEKLERSVAEQIDTVKRLKSKDTIPG